MIATLLRLLGPILVVLLGAGCVVTSVSSPAAVHEVRAGETLARIADAYGVRIEHLAAVNRIANPDRIEVGWHLALPEGARLRHRVRSGETLAGIAALYLVSAQQLARENRLGDPDRIREGSVLWLPRGATLPPGPSPPERARALVERAERAYRLAEFDAALDLSRRAQRVLGSAGDPELRGRAGFVLGATLTGLGDGPRADAAFVRMLASNCGFVPAESWMSPPVRRRVDHARALLCGVASR